MSDTFERAKSQYERKMERQKQVEKFEQVAATQSEASGLAEDRLSSHSSRFGGSEHSNGAFESARRFLRDEDEDDDVLEEDDTLSDHKQLFNRPGNKDHDWDSGSIIRGEDDAFANVDLHSTYGNRSYASGPYNPSTSNHHSRNSVTDKIYNPNPILSSIAGMFLSCWQWLSDGCSILSEYAIEMWMRLMSYSRRQKLILLGILAAVIVLIILIVVLATSGGGGGESSNTDSSSHHGGSGGTGKPTSGPTVVPQHPLVPSDPERYETIRRFILDADLTHVSELDAVGSYQNRALHWVVENDVAHVRPDSLGLLQRYALASLFFSTYVATLDEENERPPNASGAAAANQQEEVIQWNESTNWMTSKGICDWYGVHCVDNIYNFEESSDGNQNVVHLDLSRNSIEGAIPSELVALNRLTTLDLSGNNLFGAIPKTLGNLQHLVHLNLHDNKLTGEIPTELGECVHLRVLDLSNNELIGPVPVPFESLWALRTYNLGENMLVGQLPNTVNMTHLEILQLDDNDITGEIPPEYGFLGTLKVLNLRNNKLHGAIPSEVGLLSNLETLTIGFNHLTSTIPTTIGGMIFLTDFEIPHNQISGIIPHEIGSCKRMEVIRIEANQMTGRIPHAITKMEDLRSFHFFRNNFTGTVPDALCDNESAPRPKHLAGDCGPGGGVTCSCCNRCYR